MLNVGIYGGGNGLAQVYNWKEPALHHTSINTNAILNKKNHEELQRRVRREDDYKKIADLEKTGDAPAWYRRDLTTKHQKLHNATVDAYDKTQDINATRSITQQDRDSLARDYSIAQQAGDLYTKNATDIDQGKYINKDFYDTLNKDLLMPSYGDEGLDYTKGVKVNDARLLLNHPGGILWQARANDSIKDIKNAISKAEYTGTVPGINQMFWQKKGESYNLPVDESGNPKQDFVNYIKDQSPQDSKAIIWKKIADTFHLDPNHDRQQIDQKLHELESEITPGSDTYNPEVAKTTNEFVYKQYENLIRQHIQHEVIESRQSQGREFNPNGTGDQIQSNIQKDPNLFQYNKFDEIEKNGGIASHGDGSVPYNSDKMSNLEGIYPGKKATFVGTKIDPKTGNAVAQFTDEKGYPLPDKTLDQDMIARLKNVAKSRGEGNKVLQETEKVEKSGGKMYVNEPELNQKAEDFSKLLFNKDQANDNKDQYAENLKNFLKENGIHTDVEVDRNYGAQFINGGPFVKIKDQKFDLSKPKDEKKIKSLLFDSNPAGFSSPTKQQKKSTFDPNNPL